MSKQKTDEQFLAELYTEGMSNQEKFEKASRLYNMLHHLDYCNSMAYELSTENPSAQALWWAEISKHSYAIEEECKRLQKLIEVYTGDVDEAGNPHGYGIKHYTTGNRYEGNWVHGKREGFGIEYADDGRKAYEGNWKNSQEYGTGILIDYRGVKYEGTFGEYPHKKYTLCKKAWYRITYPGGEIVEGKDADGNDTCTYPNGDVFICEDFTEAGIGGTKPLAYGTGTYKYADGSVLKGRWRRNEYCDGEFEYTSPDGTKEIWKYQNNEVVSKTKVES